MTTTHSPSTHRTERGQRVLSETPFTVKRKVLLAHVIRYRRMSLRGRREIKIYIYIIKGTFFIIMGKRVCIGRAAYTQRLRFQQQFC